jgi:hypothetical protein
MNISLPSDLRRRMDQVSKRTAVNWSALACAAFDSRIREIESEHKDGGKMLKAIERLRALDKEGEKDATTYGMKAGRDWVCEAAKPSELRRLERMTGEEFEAILTRDRRAAFCIAEKLAFVMLPDEDQDRDGASDFWSRAMRGTAPEDLDDVFLRGFVSGALEAWEEIKPQL